MRIKIILILTLCISSIQYIYPKSYRDSLLITLDNVIQNRSYYEKSRMNRINIEKEKSKKNANDHLSLMNNYDELYNLYISFQSDSAINYAKLKKREAIILHDTDKELEADLNLAQIYSIAGLYIESYEILKNINNEQLSPFLRSYYYTVNSTLYESIYQSIDNENLKKIYSDLLHKAFIKQLKNQTINNDGNSYYYTQANIYNLEGRYKAAQEWLCKNYHKMNTNKRELAIYYYLLAESSKNTNVERKKIEEYYIKSAIIDLELGIKEHLSLFKLAEMLYEDGQIKRPYKYLKISLEDSKFCNSQKRLLKVTQLLSIIESSYLNYQNRQKNILFIFLFILSATIIILIILLFMITKLYNKNKKIQKELVQLNSKLQILNDQLFESNILKQTYIVHYMDICLKYIDDVNKLLKNISKQLPYNSKIIKDLLDPTKFENESLNYFYNNFDDTFLHLFPSFVDEYNKLLNPKDQIILKNNNKLNTELRIYALIRLGITDNAQIAHFLHCSISTVYNNRTQARNKSKINRSLFEEEVKKISSLKKLKQ